jgi:hypothetical protein
MEQTMRRQAWVTFFTGLVSMNEHPGTTRDLARHRPLEECAALADQMLKMHDTRVERGEI